MKKIFISLLFVFTFIQIQSQEKKIIKLGVRYNVNNNKIKKDSTLSDNLYYSFEYDFLKMFEKFINSQEKYKIEYIKINQGQKLKYLNSSKNKVDAVIYAVSITEERLKNYSFSLPYFSNKSIVLASYDSKNILDLDNDVRIGYITNTTSGFELKKLTSKKPKLIIHSYNNFKELITALKGKEIDAITGDRSLLASYFLSEELFFKGDLPTRKAQIGDFYGVISSLENVGVINLFNEFIRKNDIQIIELSNKYFTIVDNKLMKFKPEKVLSYRIIALGILFFILLIFLIIWFFLKKIKKMKIETEAIQNNQIINETKDQLTNILESAFNKFRDKLDSKEIADLGVEFFNSAEERVTYVGSGGFLSDEKFGKIWRKAMHDSLNRGVIIDRIIDLPQINFYKLQFKNMNYFHPENYDRTYVQKYLKWLLLQYIDFVNFGDNFKIHNSRGASLWGYGLVIMIKDNSEVLLFTTNQDKKIGSVIVNQELALHFSELMKIIKNVGKEIDEHDLEREFFTEENNLKKLINDFKNIFQKNNYIELSKEFLERIDRLSLTINKRFNEFNNK